MLRSSGKMSPFLQISRIIQRSVELLSVFLSLCRDSYWPNGILAETPPRRDKSIRMRTRVAAKTSLLGIMPGIKYKLPCFV